MLQEIILLLVLAQIFEKGSVSAENPRADLFNLAAFKNVPANVRLSVNQILNSPFGSLRSGSVSDDHDCEKITSVPRHLTFITRHRFYTKYTHAYNIPIISSNQVSNKALTRACHIVRFLFADRRDVRQSLYRNFGRFGVIGLREHTTTIPEFSHLPSWYNQRARGLGGVLGRPISTGGEENLLCLRQDRYYGDDIFFHEAAHNVAEVALRGNGIPGMYSRIVRAYNNAKRRGLYRNTYSMTDSREYFAEGMQSFFNNHPDARPPNGIHNHVNTRAELREYDPTLYRIIKEAYPCMNTYYTCTNNQRNMRSNCDGSTRGKTTPTKKGTTKKTLPTECVTTWETVSNVNQNCYDRNIYCTSWARQGYCRSSWAYMKSNCCKSCNGGAQAAGTCRDQSSYCPFWASRGECNRNPRYMKVSCKKSCKVCSEKKKVVKCRTVTPPSPSTTVMTPPLPTTQELVTPPLPGTTTNAPNTPPLPGTTEAPNTPPLPGTTKAPNTPPLPGTTEKPNTPPVPTDIGPPPVPKKCETPVAAGIENKRVPDGAMTASSSVNKWHGPHQARLNLKSSRKGVGAWCAGIQDKNQFLQVDLGIMKTVKKLDVQGRDSPYAKYVTKFNIEYSEDNISWVPYVDDLDFSKAKVFAGNTDTKSVKSIEFDYPFIARYIRIKPQEWKNLICMRIEVYYCS
ncbi:uncharacterized protein LOC130635707 [Hydractinia symbiolongicarpus]|uniref:uncharacterized protein LOC130635707 n=1 Tax=Hydractinia symbiolongicarpus TaxID=13093 RepID=UPI00255183A4|nr:uncharacterized protein LOC130635707 [Hydractinia symbiolongicarpus]